MLDEFTELLVREITDRVSRRLNRMRGVVLAGGIEVRITTSETREWEDVCKASSEFKALEASDLDLMVARKKFEADPMNAELETAFRNADAIRDKDFESMRNFASRWYDQLRARSPGYIRQ